MLLLLAMSAAEAQARACPMDSAHHPAEPDHASHAQPDPGDIHEAHGAAGPLSRVHDVPADPVQSGVPCAMSLACAPAAVMAPLRLSLAARQPDWLSMDWPILVHSSADLLPPAPPPRSIA